MKKFYLFLVVFIISFAAFGSLQAQELCSSYISKYQECYGCKVVRVLTDAFISAGSKAYEVSKTAANTILIVITALWMAFFVLKNVSSVSAIEPMKMLQDLMIELFKVMLAFVIINSGIETILHYTLVPIMNAGTSVGDAIMETGKVSQNGGGK